MRKAINFTVAVALFLGIGFSVFAATEETKVAPAKVAAKKSFCSKSAAKLAVSVRSNKCDKAAAKLLVSGVPALKCEKSAATLVKSVRAAGCEKSAAALIVKAADGVKKTEKKAKPAS